MIAPQATFLNAAGWGHLLVYGIWLPILVIRQARKVAARKAALPQRLAHFRTSTLSLVYLAAGSFAVAKAQRIGLFPREVPALPGVVAGIVMYVLAVAVMLPKWRNAVVKRARVVHLFVADTWQERGWWLAVSLAAGIGEEITWRGVQTALLMPLVGEYWVAGLISGISFALAHWMQGWRSAVGILLFAMGFQAIVFLSGSLYVAMAVHVAYDITCGLCFGRFAREMGYTPDLGEPATAS